LIVVSDTSPINYLILIEEIEILSALYERVLIPESVYQELQHSNVALAVRNWIAQTPKWLEVRSVIGIPDPILEGLDPGERDAISLALRLKIETILIDEREGRRAAQHHKIQVIGTLGVLEHASTRGLLALGPALSRLQKTSFRVRSEIIEDLLDRAAKRKCQA
jgi:predicted nucleic acid-binding protein